MNSESQNQNQIVLKKREEIERIFTENELHDLKRFMSKRQCLNGCNMGLIYLFHFVQSVGILVTTIATGYNRLEFIWLGIGLNLLASLLNIYEQLNNNISKKIMKDIKAIRDGTYIDEGLMVDASLEKGKNQSSSSPTNQNDLGENHSSDV